MCNGEDQIRICTRCLESHPVSFFNRDRTRADGVYPQCKNCSRRAGRRAYKTYKPARQEMNQRWKKENAERHAEINKSWVAANRDKVCGYYRSYRQRNPEVVGRWQRENPDRVRENQRRWADDNREHRNALARINDKANPTRRRAKNAKYRAALLKATPAWADNEMIALIYAECPPGHDVDHIFPLKGRNSCGLHVVANLQYLPSSENRRKSNKVPAVQEAW